MSEAASSIQAVEGEGLSFGTVTHIAASGPGFRFGVFDLDTKTGELRKEGRVVHLRNQPFQVLSMLLGRAGDLVTRDEFKTALWSGDVDVDVEQGLNYCIKEIRSALGDHAESPRFVQTFPRRGYRFMGEVTALPGDAASPDATPPAARAAVPSEAVSITAPKGGSPFRTAALVAAVLGLGALGLATFVSWGQGFKGRSPPAPAQRPTRLMVLPFQDLTPGGGDPLFADGLTEDVIAHIGRANPARLLVLARTSSMSFKTGPRDLRKIASELDVDYFVEGTIRGTGTIRISASLVRAADLTQLWSDTVDREIKDLLPFQSALAEGVARGVDVAVVASARTSPLLARSSEAYLEYLRGRTLWSQRDEASLKAALLSFEKSVAWQDDFAPAWVGIADTYYVLTDHGHISARDGWLKAKAAADRALALDPQLAEAWTSVAMYRALYEWNATSAREAFERALALNPNYSTAHHWFALVLAGHGDRQGAVNALERAASLDPLSTIIRGNLGQALAHLGRHQEALKHLHTVIDLRPKWATGYLWLGRARGAAERWDEAVTAFETAVNLEPSAAGLAHLSRAYAKSGRIEDGRRIELRMRNTQDRYVSPYYLALAAWSLGNPDRAILELNRAFEERSPLLRQLPHGPDWVGFERDPRFARMVSLLEAPDPITRPGGTSR